MMSRATLRLLCLQTRAQTRHVQKKWSSTTTAASMASTTSTPHNTSPLASPLSSSSPSSPLKVTSETDIFRAVEFIMPQEKTNKENEEFRATLNRLFNKHRPSSHPFFSNLKNMPKEVMLNKGFLNELYLRYQTAMHSTRAAVYRVPYLDSPQLRQRKIKIILDDDATNGVSHHQQLENMFVKFGADLTHKDRFGDLETLTNKLDPETTQFVDAVRRLYSKSTGAWCVMEVLSDDWLSAFADSLSSGFPYVFKEQYFDEVFSGHVETQHMLETVALTEDVLARYPSLLKDTLFHAEEMSGVLNKLWDNLNNLVLNPTPYLTKN